MAYTVDVKLKHAEIAAFLYGPGSPVVRSVRGYGRQVQAVAMRRAPKDTGQLTTSIRVETGVAPGFVYADIGSPLHYAIWVHEGTGIYGPGRPIRPKRARAMRFKPGKTPPSRYLSGAPRSDPRNFVFAKQVKGQPGVPYLTSALTDVMSRVPRARIRMFKGRGRRGR